MRRTFIGLTMLALAAGWVALPEGAAGQEEMQGSTLNLADALRLARQNNPQFKQSENDAAAAEWAVRSAYAGLMPTASATGTGQYQAEGNQRFGLFTSADIGQASTTDYLTSAYSLTVQYSLSANTFATIGSARADRDAATARIEAAGFTMESVVTAQYMAALRAKDAVRVTSQALERADENLELVSARVGVGAAAATDGKQAEVTYGRAQVAMLQAENLGRTEMNRLMEQIGLPLSEGVELSSEFDIFEPEWSLEELTARALEAHPNLLALRKSEDAREAGIWQARSQYLPSLNIFANWSGFARQVGNKEFLLGQARDQLSGQQSNCEFMNEISAGLTSPLAGFPSSCSGFELSLEDEQRILAGNQVFPFNWDPDPFALTVQVQIPIFQGFTRQVAVEQARNRAEDAREARRAEELRLRTAVTTAYDDVKTNHQVVGIEERNLEAAREQHQMARERYRLGAAAYLELLDAEDSLRQAERDYIGAEYSFQLALTQLEFAVGAKLITERAAQQ